MNGPAEPRTRYAISIYRLVVVYPEHDRLVIDSKDRLMTTGPCIMSIWQRLQHRSEPKLGRPAGPASTALDNTVTSSLPSAQARSRTRAPRSPTTAPSTSLPLVRTSSALGSGAPPRASCLPSQLTCPAVSASISRTGGQQHLKHFEAKGRTYAQATPYMITAR
ncbi:hypothetical protein NUW54_g9442 [Trametes sanguinea]|uniref:Uncharacterized protein n=1 Tax=Trametes sanguinea TaxID=158606 RepID=A0ACC1P8M9_9APHY|nr:hypothetical protein NUW54_g9442 [Trametes sanguinea]